MAEVKISALTSATTPLAGTEVVPIVQGGVTKQVAVSEIGGNTPTVNVLSMATTEGTQVTGTTAATISRSIYIQANTLSADVYLNILARYERIGASTLGTITMDIWKNTTNSLTGATKIGSCSSLSSTQRIGSFERNMWINSNLLYFLPNGSNTPVDNGAIGNFVWSTTTFDTTIDNYILIAVTLANSADTAVVKSLLATSYE